jgi:galactokinase
LCDSGVKHTLVDSEYNTRREECEEGVAVLKQYNPAISTLRDVSTELLKQHAPELRPVVFRRCNYVVEEIARVQLACAALQRNDLHALGQLMFQTHDGLNLEYEVSVPEINFLVEKARANPSVLGARMMGGGFGGCTINLVETAGLEDFIETTRQAYFDTYGIVLKTYPVRLTGGTEIVF